MLDERAYLQSLQRQPFGQRLWGYLRLSGPAYMQSAMTLGGGSIASCVAFGSLLGYELLWVQPLAMVLGVIVLAAIATQVTHTGERPYAVFWQRLHPAFAILWGAAALVSTIIWHFPQYTLSANGAASVFESVGLPVADLGGTGQMVLDGVIGVLLLGGALYVTRMYHRGLAGVRHFETATKILVWTIVIAFAIVTVGGGIEWGRFFRGLLGIDFAQRLFAGEVPRTAIVPIVGGMAAALGINMVFLYPYSLLRKGWGREYKEMAYFDLLSGMMIPFLFATGFMVLAVAGTIGPKPGEVGEMTRNIAGIVPVLGPSIGSVFGSEAIGNRLALFLIGLGMTAVGFTSIITHMLACGFIGAEMTGRDDDTSRWWFSLIPAVGVFGVFASSFPWYMAITASSLNAPLLPITVVCFMVLLNSKAFLGEARPEGIRRILWNVGLSASVITMVIASYFGLTGNWKRLMDNLFPDPPPEAAAVADDEAVAAAGLPEAWDEAFAPDPDQVVVQMAHRAMGTEFTLALVGSQARMDSARLESAGQAAFDAIDTLEASISTWIPDSDASRINQRAATEPVAVGADVVEVLRLSRGLYHATDGAFDVSVGPLVQLWREARRTNAQPSEDAAKRAADLVGLSNVTLSQAAPEVRFAQTGMALDFGGIGKGMALDRAVATLREQGVPGASVSGGESSVRAYGASPSGEAWTVNVEKPYTSTPEILARIPLRNRAFSNSVARSRGEDGTLRSHIFDPRTGLLVDEVASCCVVDASAAHADALSTAFCVSGEDGARAYCAQHPETEVLLLLGEEGQERLVAINWTDNEGLQTGATSDDA